MPFSGHRLMLILGSLINKDRSALEIIDAVAKATKNRTKISVGSIYTQLERLERQGLVRGKYATEKPAERGSRPRRYYKITAKGCSALREIDSVRGIAWVSPGTV